MIYFRFLAKIGLVLFAVVCLAAFALMTPGGAVTAQEPVLPLATPDAANGLEIFADRCANCHGPLGAGDGELAADLPSAPVAFNAPDYRLTAPPAMLFETMTNGRIDLGMPPFGPASSNPIDEADRWDLVAAIYSLSTPIGAIESGAAVYAANCAACHGETGLGDGVDSAELSTPPPDLTSLDYWFNRSNADVVAGTIAAHELGLSTAELSDVVDFSRTFSYAYRDPLAAAEPIALVQILGQVTNATTTAAMTDGEVLLRAFTPEFEQIVTQTLPVDANGTFQFELENVPADWIFVTSMEYDGLSYSSAPSRADRVNPQLNLPINVYDKTTDSAVINIGQLHTVMDFIQDRVVVNEVYVFNNADSAVFVGETGDPAGGTVEIALPAGAENVEFQRSFGSFENFLPATELIKTDAGYADVVPLRPGTGSMNLLVRYDLPFSSGMTIAHPVHYDVERASVMLPDRGVGLVEGDWTAQDSTNMGEAGTFLNFLRAGLLADEALSFELDGRPQTVTDVSGNTVAVRNEQTELIFGGLALLAAVGVGIVMVRSWQNGSAEAVPSPEMDSEAERDQLLQSIANLDDAYDAGNVDSAVYEQHRTTLLNQLAAIWSKPPDSES